MRIPLIGGSASSFALSAAAQQSFNIYRESIEGASGRTVIENASEKNTAVLRGIPGIHLFKDLTSIDASANAVRGLFSGGGRLFVAAGSRLLEINSSGGSVSNSAIANDGNPVDILANGNQLFVSSYNLSYCNNGSGLVQNTLPALAGTVLVVSGSSSVLRVSGDSFDIGMLSQTMTIGGVGYTVSQIINPNYVILSSNYAGASSLAATWSCTPVMNTSRATFMDGYFIVSRPSSRQFNISKLLDGSTWSQLDFALKEGHVDNLLAVFAEPPLLYLLGTETLEIWRNTGAASFPFERVDGGFARIGLAAVWSPSSINGRLHMLAGGTYGQTIAVRMEGTTPIRISTHAQEEAWAGASAMLGQGWSYSYVDRGHWFWVVNFFGANYSWVYDATESALSGRPEWHQRARWDGAAWQQYRPFFHTYIPEWGTGGKHIVGDQGSGKLYEMSSDFFDDAGSDIRCVRAMTHLYGGGARQYMSRLEVEMETGTSWNAGANTPTLTLDWSNDRGHTFAGGPRTLSTGAANAYTQRVYANQLGSYRDRVMRLTVQGQAKVALIDVQAEIHGGTL